VTTPRRTAFDLARRERTEAVVGLDALLRRGVTDADDLRAYLRTKPGWPGVVRATAALALANPLAESPMEARLAFLPDGDHHRDRATFRRDVARLNALRAAGWTVLRFTADDVLFHPARVITQVKAVLG